VRPAGGNFAVDSPAGDPWLPVPAPAGDRTQLDALAQVPAARSGWGVGLSLPFPENPRGIFQGVILQDGP
jgi:hypothetical protein